MKSKTQRRRPARPAHVPITHEQIEQVLIGLGFVPPAQPSAPPPPPASVKSAPASLVPILWNFSHTHPQLPNAILHCCIEAPTIAEARGKAYLLAENFTHNIIGFIRANAPTQLPAA